MPNDAAAQHKLEPFNDWYDARFRRPDGKPFRPRVKRRVAAKLGLPIVKIGWAELVDGELGDRLIAAAAGLASPTHRRGRPRAGNESTP
jgi:hypothetical protein